MTSGLSFRDPENQAFHHAGEWWRIAEPSSAQALRRLRGSDAYVRLVNGGLLVRFDEAEQSQALDVTAAARSHATRRFSADVSVFHVESIPLVSYPWEWPNGMLATAAQATLAVRRELLSVGLDLKDASAFNIQFRGSRPVLMDVGSIDLWRPSPGWSASRQFIEHFINPLAVGYGKYVASAQAWRIGGGSGLTSSQARALMPARLRVRPGLFLLQSSTRAIKGHEPVETRYANEATRNPDLAKRATLSLTKRLEGHTKKLLSGGHQTTWADYGAREHYASPDLERKTQWATQFVTDHATGPGPVLDVGGNDGLVGSYVVEKLGTRVVVLDPDTGALEALLARVANSPTSQDRITPLVGDLAATSSGAGLLGEEFSAFRDRVRPSAVLCQAVLHHLTITQGVPLTLSARALAQFRAPLQVEFATEDDEKVRLLISQIPNWSGDYSTQAAVASLEAAFEQVEIVGQSTPTRIVINCASPRGVR